METDIVTKLPIMTLVWYFIMYIVIHVAIGMYVKKVEGDYMMEDRDNHLKWSKIAFKWFPFAYVLFVIISLYVR